MKSKLVNIYLKVQFTPFRYKKGVGKIYPANKFVPLKIGKQYIFQPYTHVWSGTDTVVTGSK